MSDNFPHHDPNPTQPLPPASAPPANATPFDTQLVDDPNAPRYTQPLPSQFAPLPHAAPLNSTPSAPSNATPNATPATTPPTPTYAPHSLPRQVVPDTDTNNVATTSSTRITPPIAPAFSPPTSPNTPVHLPTSSLPASRPPLTTIVGLAAIGGALMVVLGSAFFRRLAPVPEAARGNSAVIVEKKAPANTIILQRPNEDNAKIVIVPNDVSRENNATSNENTAPQNAIVAPDENPMPRDQNSSSGDIEYSNPSREEETTPNNTIRDNDTSREKSSRNTDSINDTSASDNSTNVDSSSEKAAANNASSRFVERRRAYSISPPREFRLTQKGRRTIWKGANGAQLLVEVGQNDGETPRAGWEKLDRALQKKYGSRYKSRGIRDLTLNGRQAAAWEFDLKQKNGTVVRKMDVALVDKNNGYAVLASAPVEEFEAMRPTWNRVLDSFQIESTNDNLVDNSNNTIPGDDVSQGF